MIAKSRFIEIYDTTLRDGSQGMGVSFSLQDKISLTLKLDEFGIPFIEGGWPASNPKDEEYFKSIKEYSLKQAKIVAFGSTRRHNLKLAEDENLNAIIKCDVDYAAIVGKSWTLHVKEVLKTSLNENLDMVYDSITFLRDHGIKVVFDAEHFYDGYKEDPEYAVKVLETAREAGAERLVLCDTNGGTLTHEFYEITKRMCEKFGEYIGVHCHNDSGLAVANSLMAVIAGAVQVQGTINGLGERCGNADLCQIIPALEVKMGYKALRQSRNGLQGLRSLSMFVYELVGMEPNKYQPYTGQYAFAHKAGMHSDAVIKNRRAYEHIDPSIVGNERLIAVSELSGRAAIMYKAKKFGLNLDKSDPAITRILRMVKELEARGKTFENADGSLYLVMLKALNKFKPHFEVLSWRVTSKFHKSDIKSICTIKLKIKNRILTSIAEGIGPVHAQDLALLKALRPEYPMVEKVELANYKVSIVGRSMGTASMVRVLIEFKGDEDYWSTTGASTNILEASIEALVEGYEYYLHKHEAIVG
ncbi:MAG: citramalate synthase [Candidatus Nezhaarchaeota archaeon]|nr:citramalate synthase [Candidatus Nezhaarchaeota archaeon]MCX8142486.1 citramalate synthase [Candidatus Nezhaarchaeota archaeon]MDW8050541.1 citramalate synthase [Nitrososphaerota archaeon]